MSNSNLDERWQVIDGMLTVRKIEAVAVGANSKPKLPIVISQCGVSAKPKCEDPNAHGNNVG